MSERQPRAHLGLRARVTTAFALGALLLSVTLSVLSYGITRRYLLREGESSAVRQAYVNARLVRDGLRGRTEPDVTGLLSRLDTPAGSESVLLLRGQAHATSVAIGSNALPRGLRTTVQS